VFSAPTPEGINRAASGRSSDSSLPGRLPIPKEQWLKNARVVIKDTQQRELLVNFTPFPIILFQEPFATQIYQFNGKK